MSHMGHSLGLADVRDMSGVAPIADIGADIDFGREVPIATADTLPLERMTELAFPLGAIPGELDEHSQRRSGPEE
jgi:hypothetical protein